MSGHGIAVIGGGLCGLTAAIRLAERGYAVTLFEAAGKPGGRTRSFTDPTTGELCDNGPHLLIGAYRATLKLLEDCGAGHHLRWQASLSLPLWDAERGRFDLTPSSRLPLALAMMRAVAALPGHNARSALAMLRLALAGSGDVTVADLLARCRVPEVLVRDLLEPLCLGAMNEAIATADAASFRRVLNESFASHRYARLGWFDAPLDIALIAPLVKRAAALGVQIRCRQRVQHLSEQAGAACVNGALFDAAIVALPAYAADHLLGLGRTIETAAIANVHLWFEEHPGLGLPFVGGIGTLGQWYFDVTAQMGDAGSCMRHLCAVISADQGGDDDLMVERIVAELAGITGIAARPKHLRIVREKRATVLVREHARKQAGTVIVDASEAPLPGELPATLEWAVLRAETAVKRLTAG